MDDLVALVVGIACYPELKGWNIPGDRTAKDAVTVVTALRQRNVPQYKIKLLLSAQEDMPDHVEGVQVEQASKSVLEDFILKKLGKSPFDAQRFLLFWSGHGMNAKRQSESLLITADSFNVEGTPKNVFRCLGIDQFRAQLQGMPVFAQQLFCINACRTPTEWSVTANDELDYVHILDNPRFDTTRQAQFFAARELGRAPVDNGPDGLSNEFVAGVRDCILLGEWPPRETDWLHRLRALWPSLWSVGAQEVDVAAFRRLRDKIRTIDRRDQCSLVNNGLRQVLKWNQQPPRTTGVSVESLSEATLIDLHAYSADRLDLLMTRLQEEVFHNDKLVPDGIQRVRRWPDRSVPPPKRQQELFDELTYQLTGYRAPEIMTYRSDKTIKQIVDGLPAPGPCVRVVFVEIDGPCTPQDSLLVVAMRDFWQRIIGEAWQRGNCLPLLLVGHVDPDSPVDGIARCDTTGFYRNTILDQSNERRLNLVRGDHLRTWLNDVVPRDRFPERGDLEAALVVGLEQNVIEQVNVRMEKIINLIIARADGGLVGSHSTARV